MTFDDKTRVDLYRIEYHGETKTSSTAYFWEVKPGSYLLPSKMKNAKIN